MQISKITAIILALGAIFVSSKANAIDLSSTIPIQLESQLQLAQVNLQDAATYLNQGIKVLEQGDYQQAISYLTKAIQNNPKLVAAYYNRAIARHQLQEYQRAIADFTKVIQINQKDAEAYYNRGVARLSLKDYQTAITDFTKAIQINPKLDIAYYNRGMARGFSRDEAGGMADLQKAVSLYRNQGESIQAQKVVEFIAIVGSKYSRFHRT